jgi:hypothetical protein
MVGSGVATIVPAVCAVTVIVVSVIVPVPGIVVTAPVGLAVVTIPLIVIEELPGEAVTEPAPSPTT